MSESTRPGGLIALAILNFLFGAIGFLVVSSRVLSLAMKEQVIAQDPRMEVIIHDITVTSIIFGTVLTVLLIVSGVGYLKQKRKLGYLLGNLTSVIWMGYIILTTSGFNIMSSALFLFPVLTLMMLNVMFKEDFINP